MDLGAVSGTPVTVSVRPLDAPARTPAEVLRLARGLRHPAVLAGEWAAGEIVLAADPTALELTGTDPFSVLDRQPSLTGPVPKGAVGGGWFGWLGFEPGKHALGFYPNVICRRDGHWWDEALVGLLDDDVLEGRRQALRALVTGPLPSPMAYAIGSVTSSRDRAGHVAAVERCVHDIRDGEIYQANICLTLQASVDGSEADLAADLLAALAPPYGAYLALGERRVASASPELFLRRTGRHVTSRPIKGTRPRHPETADDEARRLAGSAKDRAENVMIVDLVRNDLSRVAGTGWIRVRQLLDVVAHPGVWHLVSSVEARLAAGVTDGDLLRAAFPPGSVTGVPKRRALEAIAELEDRPRGIYTGAIGYASPVAGLELSVAIRTLEMECDGTRGRLSLGVGGGITVDSTPAEEWWECFDKARPLLAGIGAGLSGPLEGQASRPARDPLAERGVCDTSLLRRGRPLERSDHLARLERSLYELYQRPLPAEAAEALLHDRTEAQPWERQRIDVAPDGTVLVTRLVVDGPVPVSAHSGAEAVVLASDAGFGGHKWSDRRRQGALEAAHPDQVVIVGGRTALLESTSANVIAVIAGRLVTAPLAGTILPGVTRTVLLDLARDMGVDIELQAPDPQQAQALAVVSSVAGVRWIRRIGGAGWELGWEDPGDLLRELSRRLVERWAGVTADRVTVEP